MGKRLTAAAAICGLALTACGPNLSSTIVATPTSPAASGTARPGAFAQIPSSTPKPPTPAPTPERSPIGTTHELTSDAGLKIEVTVHALRDQVRSTNQFNAPQGRYVVLDWEVTNEGAKDATVSAYDFKLQTADGYLFTEANHAGLPQPEIASTTLGQGQNVRGFVAYDVPIDAALKSAIYQPSGQRQFVIADLTQGQ